MSTIKELIDLTIELSNRTQNRQFASEISKIQSLISTLQKEHADIMSENIDMKSQIFEMKQTHSKEVSSLRGHIFSLQCLTGMFIRQDFAAEHCKG